MANSREDSLRNDIQHYFGFLLSNGYKIRDMHFLPGFGDWQVVLESQTCILLIYTDRNWVDLVFFPDKSDDNYRIGLETLIYFLDRGEVIIKYYEGNLAWGKKKQFERLSGLLKEYYDQITHLFETDSQRLKEELAPAQKKYGELLQKSYSQKFTTGRKVGKGLRLVVLLFKFIGIVFWLILAGA